MSGVTYVAARTNDELRQVVALCEANLKGAVDPASPDGFLSVHYTLDQLRSMNDRTPHALAKAGDAVVGYALGLPRDLAATMPVLDPMLASFPDLPWGSGTLDQADLLVMGQVCVAASHRGQGVFRGVYHHLRSLHAASYDVLVTEISLSNPRSLAAHTKLGMRTLRDYAEPDGSQWRTVAWDWA